MKTLFLVLVLLSTAWTLLGATAVWFVTRRSRRVGAKQTTPGAASPEPTTLRPISVLKPLCGADPTLSENLESFFEQDHPNYEIVFGVESANDPAVPVVRALIERHPERHARLVIHTALSGANPKVRNLRGMISHANHDLVVVSDSNIRVPRHYLSELVVEHGRAPNVGLVTNLIRGVGDDRLGGALSSVELAGFCAAGAAMPTLFGEALVIGKSMSFSKTTLERLGGFESVANVLAEDYVIGKMFQHAGYKVVVAPTVVDNVTAATTVVAHFERNRRWAMLRWRIRPFAYFLEPVTSPLAVLPMAWALMGPVAVVWAAILLVVRDVGQWIVLSGSKRAWVPLVLSPLRELTALSVWLSAPFRNHVAWRGHRVRLSSGSVAYLAPEPARA
jgi:ceramide glucosyltransferase